VFCQASHVDGGIAGEEFVELSLTGVVHLRDARKESHFGIRLTGALLWALLRQACTSELLDEPAAERLAFCVELEELMLDVFGPSPAAAGRAVRVEPVGLRLP